MFVSSPSLPAASVKVVLIINADDDDEDDEVE
jgi:hypothetical protein